MRELFVSRKFRKESLAVITTVNAILDEYQVSGYTLTLRQLYYQMVSRGFIENSIHAYGFLGGLVSEGRLAGLIDWEMIEDRGREVVISSHWRDPAHIVQQAAKQFKINKWLNQPNYVEVMVEKQALEGVLLPACEELDVPFTANKGYSSSSAMYQAGKRLFKAVDAGKKLFVLYLGDHDPSGIDMTRDVEDRLDMFSGEFVEVKRLALNMNQIEELKPPENPAKLTDTRAASYIEKFGESSWELDAIEPRMLVSIVEDAVTELRDQDLWDEAVELEEKMKKELRSFAKSYSAKKPRVTK